MNLQLKAMRLRDVLEKGSKEHEAGSNGNETKRGIVSVCKSSLLLLLYPLPLVTAYR